MTRPATWRYVVPRLFRLLMGLGAAVASSVGETRAADSPVEAIAKKIALQTETRKSVDLRAQTRITAANPLPSVPGAFDVIEEHYIETAGKRRCDIVFTSEGKIVGRVEHFWDGSKAAAVSFAPGPEGKLDTPATVKIGRSYYKEDAGERMERPTPILFLHVGHEPLHKAILKAKPMGTGTILDRECDLFLFEQVRWRVPQDQLYYVDRETGIPLCVEGYPRYAERDKPQQHWVWKAQSLDRVGTFYIPFNSVQTQFDEKNQLAHTWTHTVQSVDFDKVFPASMFWPADTAGAAVIDTIKMKIARGAPSKSQQDLVMGTDPAHPAATAEIPRSWADWAARGLMGAGVLILVVGLVMGWRRWA